MTDREETIAAPPSPRPRGRGIEVERILWGLIAALILIVVGLGIALFAGAFSRSAPPRVPTASGQRAQPQIEVTKTATYGDWVYTCVKVPNTASDIRCSISQTLSDAKTKAPVFLWRIGQDGKGGLVAEWQTRSGVLVNRGIILEAGAEKPITIPFQACLPEGCRAFANLATDMVEKLGKAEKATATIYLVNDVNGVQLTLSVKGLSDGLAALKK